MDCRPARFSTRPAPLYVQSQRRHGWTLLQECFDDDGYSGASLDGPGLTRLLALMRRGGVDQIPIHRLDRLSRSVRHCVTLLDEFRRLEVGLVVVTAPELGHSAKDNFMLNIMASFAELERELIAARIADSRRRLKARHLRFAAVSRSATTRIGVRSSWCQTRARRP